MQMGKRVVLGMSGGVDSSVAALLLKRQGWDVVGVFIKGFTNSRLLRGAKCNWLQDRKDAQRVAAILEIPIVTLDKEREYFQKVIKPMLRLYSANQTPNPDIDCNTFVKFPVLFALAKKLGAEFVATGHYARAVKAKTNEWELHMARDKTKDQSYFLYTLTQKELSKLIFPIGSLKKGEVREIARRNKFPNWNKRSTRGVCFIGEERMKEILRAKFRAKPGKIVLAPRTLVGTHPGAMFFTIGERVRESKGCKFFHKELRKERLYVVGKSGNELIVDRAGSKLLLAKCVFIRKVNFINSYICSRAGSSCKLKARVRNLSELREGKLLNEGKIRNRWVFEFSKQTEKLASGQSLVVYEGSRVVGGGVVSKCE
ncbi:tRNA 2-thiouridine(34) synthase MnmA [Candidatus Pacearchaeota archaeon]|nr:MAG: tRNA 2-thiouridine(34) synthase MnmA [Candidatus Pacearchaeota archaeon]